MPYNSGDQEYSLPRHYLQSNRHSEYSSSPRSTNEHVYTDPHAQISTTPEEDDTMFLNRAFVGELPRDYRANWENE